MSQSELVTKVTKTLEQAGIPYMLTGSIVSSLQGEPRLTHDIDIVLVIHSADVPRLLNAFPPPDYYLDESEARDAIIRRSSFNLIDIESGEKVDFWILTNEPFDVSRFSRRYNEHLFGLDVMVSRPEDTILMKLKWSKQSGGSEKQFIDALRVYEVQGETLDLEYLKRWALVLQVQGDLERLENEAV